MSVSDEDRARVLHEVMLLSSEFGPELAGDLNHLRSVLLDRLPGDRGAIEATIALLDLSVSLPQSVLETSEEKSAADRADAGPADASNPKAPVNKPPVDKAPANPEPDKRVQVAPPAPPPSNTDLGSSGPDPVTDQHVVLTGAEGPAAEENGAEGAARDVPVVSADKGSIAVRAWRWFWSRLRRLPRWATIALGAPTGAAVVFMLGWWIATQLHYNHLRDQIAAAFPVVNEAGWRCYQQGRPGFVGGVRVDHYEIDCYAPEGPVNDHFIVYFKLYPDAHAARADFDNTVKAEANNAAALDAGDTSSAKVSTFKSASGVDSGSLVQFTEHDVIDGDRLYSAGEQGIYDGKRFGWYIDDNAGDDTVGEADQVRAAIHLQDPDNVP